MEVVIYDNGELNEMVNQRVVRTGMLFVLCAVHAGYTYKIIISNRLFQKDDRLKTNGSLSC